MKKLLGLLTLVLLACSGTSQEENAGVTSTGNAGEVAGIVVVELDAALSKTSMTGTPVDSALVTIFDHNMQLIDSMRTNLEVSFWFRNVAPGDSYVRASLNDDVTEYDVHVEKGNQSLLDLVLNGESSELAANTLRIGLYSAKPGRVWQRLFFGYKYDEDLAQIDVTRWNSFDDSINGTWMVQFNNFQMNLRNQDQGTCEANRNFFSTLQYEVVDNNWFFNGDLAEEYLTDDYCDDPLESFPEMKFFRMSGLELQFELSGVLKAALYDHQWCLSDAVDLNDVYRNGIPADAEVTIRDCNSFEVTTKDSVQYVVRVLWLDPGFGEGIEEIQSDGNVWVRRGLISEFSLSW